jgi:hypothetical protein
VNPDTESPAAADIIMTVSTSTKRNHNSHIKQHHVAPATTSHPQTTPLTYSRDKFALVQFILILGIAFCIADTVYIVTVVEGINDPLAALLSWSQQQEMADEKNKNNRGMSVIDLHDSSQLKASIQDGIDHHQLIENQSRRMIVDATDKEPIYALLKEAGIDPESLDKTIRNNIPTWTEVTSLYGAQPVIYGLETCQLFRESSDPAEHFIGVAGTFNTGTNLLSELLIHNCHMSERMKKHGPINRGIRWQVPYGKHTPVDNEEYRLSHRTEGDANILAENVFVAAIIRDPAVWAPSMCRHAYAMNWSRNEGHCPNLIANEQDVLLDESLALGDAIPVSIEYAEFTKTHTTMMDHYSDFYGDYVKATFPRVIVRFEDLIFFPKQVVSKICKCAGGELEDGPFTYIVESAKKGSAHGKRSQRTGYVDAIIKYGRRQARWLNMTAHDLEYTKRNLDPNIMTTFHYLSPE